MFFQDNPEDCGLFPDGATAPPVAKEAATQDREYSLRQALCGFSFWPFALGLSLHALTITALTFNVESVFSEAGLVAFTNEVIGAPKEWLIGYFDNLIKRRELFCVSDNGRVIASGECRGYDVYQTDYADLGMIVAESERGKGLATTVLKELVTIAGAKGLKPICSTEAGNMAAQKAITRAGFVAPHRIVQFDAQAELLNSVVG